MPRASESQKAERLNRARDLLLPVDQVSDAVEQLVQDCSISPRRAPGNASPALCVNGKPCRVVTLVVTSGPALNGLRSRCLLW